jgi:hypothetical protein
MFMILPPPFCLKKGILALVQFSMAEIIFERQDAEGLYGNRGHIPKDTDLCNFIMGL